MPISYSTNYGTVTLTMVEDTEIVGSLQYTRVKNVGTNLLSLLPIEDTYDTQEFDITFQNGSHISVTVEFGTYSVYTIKGYDRNGTLLNSIGTGYRVHYGDPMYFYLYCDNRKTYAAVDFAWPNSNTPVYVNQSIPKVSVLETQGELQAGSFSQYLGGMASIEQKMRINREFLQGIALGQTMLGIEVVAAQSDKFWSGENLLTEAQLNLSNWNRVLFQSFQNNYANGKNRMTVTPDDFYDRLYLPVTIQAYTTYVFTGLYRSVSGTTIEESYEPTFAGERNAILASVPGNAQLHTYEIMDMSVPLYTQASGTYRRYTVFACSKTTRTVYLVIDFGKYKDFVSTEVIWKDLCFAAL